MEGQKEMGGERTKQNTHITGGTTGGSHSAASVFKGEWVHGNPAMTPSPNSQLSVTKPSKERNH